MTKTLITSIIVSVLFGVSYFALLPSAKQGYGYMGYNGYSSGPSFWYFGGPSIYRDKSVRNGSVGGGGIRGGGPGSGK